MFIQEIHLYICNKMYVPYLYIKVDYGSENALMKKTILP